jgi:pimeloyl-ACP methyl ester carboxylesterase
VLIAFRGTQTDRITDLITDMDTTFRTWDLVSDGGRVHKGFARTARGLWDDDVRAWLEGQRGAPARLIICGHSLGAAIATLLAGPAHALLKVRETQLVTIGSPRVGDEAFVAKLQSTVEVHRLVNCCDLVTELPPSLERLPFAHAGEPIYIGRDGSLQPFDIRRQDRAQAREDYLLEHAFRFGTVAVRDLADHAPANYLRAYWPD